MPVRFRLQAPILSMSYTLIPFGDFYKILLSRRKVGSGISNASIFKGKGVRLLDCKQPWHHEALVE